MQTTLRRFRAPDRPALWLGLLAMAMLMLAPVGGIARPVARAQGGATVFLDPPDQQVQLGSPATLTVRIRDVEDLAAFQFTLTFPQSVAFVGAELGPFLGSTGRAARSFPPLVEPGKLTFVAISTGAGPGASGNGVLATLRLTLEEGKSAEIGVTGALLTDTTGLQRSEAAVQGARLRTGPPPTPTRPPDQMAFLPFTVRNASKVDLPVAPSLTPPAASPTPPAPTATTTAAATLPASPTATQPPIGPTATPPPSPTAGKPEPVVSELQCYGRHEWVKVRNPSEQPLELENWTVRSTQGGEVYKIKDALTLKPAEVLTIHSGGGAPGTEDRLNKLWTQSPRWNEVDGDSAELTSPFPSTMVVSTMACATATPRAP
ncbi:MAG: lamin tail domain-containing protein [Ardenticatenia bacterium]|nr:lamin tail domain-containing protein [Ardenticatenia bacterium]